MKIAVIDYGLGNLGSLVNMFRKIGVDAVVSSDPVAISSAERLILPGVGAFDTGMENLRQRDLIPILNDIVIKRGTPILGICLGMQLMSKGSEEGRMPGLGWVDAHFAKFKFPSGSRLNIPHMGWNTVTVKKPNPLISINVVETRYYFVHSYFAQCRSSEDIIAVADYGGEFTAAFRRDNIFGVQFHPEKSHRFGMALLQRFLELRPC